jgi:hypothetical protein
LTFARSPLWRENSGATATVNGSILRRVVVTGVDRPVAPEGLER